MQYRPMRVDPCDADTAGDRGVGTNTHIVGNLDLIIQADIFASSVSSMAPRSMVVLAPISQSSPITTRPSCGTLIQ